MKSKAKMEYILGELNMRQVDLDMKTDGGKAISHIEALPELRSDATGKSILNAHQTPQAMPYNTWNNKSKGSVLDFNQVSSAKKTRLRNKLVDESAIYRR